MPILEARVERYKTPEATVESTGADSDWVRRVVRFVERSEYKRQQPTPVLRAAAIAFGMGRRFPIAAKSQL